MLHTNTWIKVNYSENRGEIKINLERVNEFSKTKC